MSELPVKEKCTWCGQKVDFETCGWVEMSGKVVPVCCPGCALRTRKFLSGSTLTDGLCIQPISVF
jgi:hypothetical protein